MHLASAADVRRGVEEVPISYIVFDLLHLDGHDVMSGLFFSEELQDIARAKAICAKCPVIAECLEGALERREPWGVWGGQLFLNGRVLASKRRRGRPPKVPRPEDQLPDVPVPLHLQDRLRTA